MGYDDIIEAAEKNGALGCCLSGAGPTMIAFLDKDYRQFLQRMATVLKKVPGGWQAKLLDICYEGANWDF